MKNILLTFLILSHFTASAQRTPPPSVGGGREGVDYAVFFVASKFDNGWTTLEHAPGEVKAIGDLLHEQYGFDVRIVTDATRAKIVQTLAEYKRKPYGPQDQLLLFFSMHGVHDADSDQGYLVPKDGLYDDPSYESWFSHGALRDLAHSMKCPRVLVALDACYSGIFGKGRDKPGPPVWENTPDCQAKVRAAFTSSPTRKYLTAGGDTRVPAKSIFAAQWQVALKTGAGSDDLLSYTELMAKLDEFRDPRPTWGNFVPGTDGDFVFVRKNPCVALPDRDGDNVPDATDKCPDEWGSQTNGCPITPDNPSDLAADLAAWKEAKRLHTETAYRGYLRQYPNGEFKEQANAVLRDREAAAARQRDDTAWDLAQEKNTLDAYKKYLADYPNGLHKSEADKKISALSTVENSGGTVMPDGMVFVKGGKFLMGSPDSEADRSTDETQHSVTVSSFYMGKYEITVAEFKVFAAAAGYQTDAEKGDGSYIWNGTEWKKTAGINWRHDVAGNVRPEKDYNHPVIHISWNDATAYCEWLSKKSDKKYRLPTEAEWEYAARGGGKTVLFGNGKNIADPKEINFDGSVTYKKSYSVAGEYRQKTVPVGSLHSPNALGLHDMSGNVWEWCSDWYADYPTDAQTDPKGPGTGSDRVIRGGSWGDGPQYCRAAYRYFYAPGNRSYNVGFRLARTN